MTVHAFRCSACERTFEFEAKSAPRSVACPSCGNAKTKKGKASAATTGTYAYSRELGTVVKLSDRVPGLAKGGGGAPMPGPSCPPGGCGGCN